MTADQQKQSIYLKNNYSNQSNTPLQAHKKRVRNYHSYLNAIHFLTIVSRQLTRNFSINNAGTPADRLTHKKIKLNDNLTSYANINTTCTLVCEQLQNLENKRKAWLHTVTVMTWGQWCLWQTSESTELRNMERKWSSEKFKAFNFQRTRFKRNEKIIHFMGFGLLSKIDKDSYNSTRKRQ